MCFTVPDVCSAGDWTQGFRHARQALFQLSVFPELNFNIKSLSNWIELKWKTIVLIADLHEEELIQVTFKYNNPLCGMC